MRKMNKKGSAELTTWMVSKIITIILLSLVFFFTMYLSGEIYNTNLTQPEEYETNLISERIAYGCFSDQYSDAENSIIKISSFTDDRLRNCIEGRWDFRVWLESDRKTIETSNFTKAQTGLRKIVVVEENNELRKDFLNIEIDYHEEEK